jgi:hypothetical protein
MNHSHIIRFIILLNICGIILNISASQTEKTYTGTIVSLANSDIRAGTGADYWGTLKFASRWGTITKPEITNLSGKEIEPGTTLTAMKKQYWRGQIIVSKGQLIAAAKKLDLAKINYDRYKKLYPTKAIPARTFQLTRATYYEALGEYETAKANLYEKKIVYSQCNQVSPMEGVVDKVYYTRGILTSTPKILQLKQLNPIGIKVKMPINEASKINSMTPITIYKENDNKPIGIYNGYSFLCDDGIIFTTKNSPKKYANTLKVSYCLPVVNFFAGTHRTQKLGIPTLALQKDKKGYYVWKAVNRKVMIPGKGINPTFKIKKTYIVPGKLKRLYNGITDMRILNNPGEIELYDLVVYDPKQKLKDGITVCLPTDRYTFMPGDKVKVVVETSPEYIPKIPKKADTSPPNKNKNIKEDIRNNNSTIKTQLSAPARTS